MKANAAFRLMRPKQWTKNLLAFAALVFAHRYVEPSAVLEAFAAFVSLCLLSSAIYAGNDALDHERDARHPQKRFRPVAAGEISVGRAWIIGGVLLFAGLAISVWLGPVFFALAAVYVAMQVAYNLKVKSLPVLDISLLSLGYVLRAVMGAAAISATISGWLLFCTGALALLLAAGKRRHEFRLLGDQTDSRPSLRGYSQSVLDGFVLVSASLAVLSYGVYAIESSTAIRYPALILTTPFVVFGVLRYLYLLFAREEGGEPESVVLDPQLLASLLAFLVMAFAALGGLAVPFIEN